MTLDSDDIRILRELIFECLGNIEPQPTKNDQIKAMARDPELARQLFRKKKAAPARNR